MNIAKLSRKHTELNDSRNDLRDDIFISKYKKKCL